MLGNTKLDLGYKICWHSWVRPQEYNWGIGGWDLSPDGQNPGKQETAGQEAKLCKGPGCRRSSWAEQQAEDGGGTGGGSQEQEAGI